MSVRKREGIAFWVIPFFVRVRVYVIIQLRIALVMATYMRRRSSSISHGFFERSFGIIPSSVPIMKIVLNSNPLAAWIVISVTQSSAELSVSWSVISDTSARKSPSLLAVLSAVSNCLWEKS